jgi:hypothetical protein
LRVASKQLSNSGLTVGLGTRLAALLLSGTMVVAILTARKDDIEGFIDVFSLSEALYVVIFMFLAAHGGGAVSADHFLARWAKEKWPSGEKPPSLDPSTPHPNHPGPG